MINLYAKVVSPQSLYEHGNQKMITIARGRTTKQTTSVQKPGHERHPMQQFGIFCHEV